MRALTVAAAALALAACSGKPEPTAGPKRETGAGSGRTVTMKKAAQAQVGVEVARAEEAGLREYLYATGTVQPVDSRVAHVYPIARGRIQEILVRAGDRVRAGRDLARFDNLEAGEIAAQHQAAQAELRRLNVERQAAARRTERNRRLAEIGAAPRKDFEASQAEEQGAAESVRQQESVIEGLAARLRRFGVPPGGAAPPIAGIPAPISGVVIAVAAAPGEVVETGRELFTIADLSTVWVQAEVYEKDLGRIRAGQTASVRVDTYGERRFTGKVTYIADVLDPKTRTVKARCEIANPQGLLKLDMFATIDLPTISQRRAVAVPESAVQQLNGRSILFVRRGEEEFEVRPVTLGMKADGLVEISSGLAAGEWVATQGAFHLKSVLLEKDIAEEE